MRSIYTPRGSSIREQRQSQRMGEEGTGIGILAGERSARLLPSPQYILKDLAPPNPDFGLKGIWDCNEKLLE